MSQTQIVTDVYFMCLGVCVVSVFITILSLILLWTGRKMDPGGTRYLVAMTLFNLALNIAYVIVAYCEAFPQKNYRHLMIISVYGEYVLVYWVCLMVVCYILYLVDQKKIPIVGISNLVRYVFFLMILVPSVNLAVPFLYDFDANNIYYEKSPLLLYQLGGLILIAINICMIWRYRDLLEREVTFSTILLFLVVGIFAIVNELGFDMDLLGFALSVSIFVMILYIEGGMVTRYMKDEKELLSVKTSLLRYQMRPHFLYNALSSISQLCKQDSRQAAVMTKLFSEYLSKNLTDLFRSEPIPFDQEIEYIKKYLRIEQLRFGDNLKVTYNIDTTDFVVPPMVMQPILENSIKHGIGIREEGGNIYISSRSCKAGHIISIADDGVGFIPEHIKNGEEKDGRVHLGMNSVRNQIKKIPNARFDINSWPGRGTITMILIPDDYS